MTDLEGWLRELAYTDFPEDLLRAGDSAGVRPYAAEIDDMLAPGGAIGASAVFCVGEQPAICFIEAEQVADDLEQRIERPCQSKCTGW